MGLVDEHLTVLVIAGFESHRWWMFLRGEGNRSNNLESC